MIVIVNEDWRIASDINQWMVQRRRKSKGRERWDSISYHGKLDGAVLRLAELRLRLIEGEFPAEELIALCRAVNSLKRDLLHALSRIDPQPRAFGSGQR